MIKLTKLEQETTINWNAEEQTASIYTATPATINKLDKMVRECPEVYRCVWEDTQTIAKRYEVNKRYIRFGRPASRAKMEANKMNAAAAREAKFNFEDKTLTSSKGSEMSTHEPE